VSNEEPKHLVNFSPSFRARRATDLLPPASAGNEPLIVDVAERGIGKFVFELENSSFTGILKASSRKKLSRSAMLLYRGRAVGGFYTSKEKPNTETTEISVYLMLWELSLSGTEASIYAVSSDILLSMSSLFLGFPVTRADSYDERSYFDYICGWLQEKKMTACLAISLRSTSSTALAFIHEGEFCGVFSVDDQFFTRDKEYLYSLFRSELKALVETSILSPETTSSEMPYGFSLSKMLNKFM